MEEEQKSKKWYFYIWNKYLIVGLIFAIWMIFFDQNSYFVHKELNEEKESLNADRTYYEREYKKDSAFMREIKTNPAAAEKVARERYYMKKDNEDLFIIDENE